MAWVFSRKASIQKQIDFQYGSRGSTAFGDVYAYDQTPPMVTQLFHGDMLTPDEISTLQTAALLPWDQSGASVALSVQGVTWAGKILSLEVEETMGTNGYLSADVTLYAPVVT